MELTVNDKNGNPAYAIKSCGNKAKGTLCFELFTWKPEHVAVSSGKHTGKTIPAGFVSQGRYPSTLPHALRMIGECVTRDSPERFELETTREGFKNLAKQIEDLLDSFQAQTKDE
jgi:hypothetical protein